MHLVYYEISTILHLPDSIQFYTLDYKIGSNSVFCSNVIVTILWRETIIIDKRQVETHEHNQRGGGGGGGLRNENNHGHHIEGSFKIEVLKTGKSKGSSEWRILKGTTDGHFGSQWSIVLILDDGTSE